jgi:hypothetical protein
MLRGIGFFNNSVQKVLLHFVSMNFDAVSQLCLEDTKSKNVAKSFKCTYVIVGYSIFF